MSFRFITGDDQGNIYAVTEHGDLVYYRDKARNGTRSWAYGGVGQRIGTGWGDFVQVLCAAAASSTPSRRTATSSTTGTRRGTARPRGRSTGSDRRSAVDSRPSPDCSRG